MNIQLQHFEHYVDWPIKNCPIHQRFSQIGQNILGVGTPRSCAGMFLGEECGIQELAGLAPSSQKGRTLTEIPLGHVHKTLYGRNLQISVIS
jgi:hypothetical protein